MSGAATEAGGKGQPKQPVVLALDVKFSDVIDFLKSRQKMSATWQQTLKAVKAKIAEVAEGLPDEPLYHPIKSGEYTYVDCRKVFEKVKAEDGEELTLLRQFKSPRVHQWYRVCKLYQRDAAHIGELATIVKQNTTYEIPSLRKEIGTLKGSMMELRVKASEHGRKAAEFADKFRVSCEEIGVKGKDLQNEVTALGQHLDHVYAQIFDMTAQDAFAKAVAFYSAFLVSTHGLSQQQSDERLELSRLLLGKTSFTVADLCRAFGIAVREEEATAATSSGGGGDGGGGDGAAGGVEIDWGDSDDEGAEGKGDGEGDAGVQGGEVEIDWGDDDGIEVEIGAVEPVGEEGEGWVDVGAGDSGVEAKGEIEIDWGDDDDEEGGGEVAVEMAAPKEVLSTSLEAIAQTLQPLPPSSPALEHTAVRARLANECSELAAFLQHRMYEVRVSDEMALQLDQQNTASEAELRGFLEATNALVGFLTSPKTQQLFLIRASPKYVERLSASIGHHQLLSRRLEEGKKDAQQKYEELGLCVQEITPRITTLADTTKRLKKELERELKELFEGRRVNVVGAVNEL